MSTELQSFIQKYDLLGCIQCGKCTGGCPVTVRTNLNVRRIVYDTLDQDMLDELAKLPEIWDCTACNTCTVRCPKGLKPAEILIGLRNILVESGEIQPTVRDALESVFLEGNPWDKPRATRSDWMQDLEVKIVEPGEKVKNLIFVCCTIAYDPRVQAIAQSFVKVLNKAGVDYGFMGNKETCCSSEVHNLGEEGLFEMEIEDNTELLNSYDAERIVAISPHCYDAFKNQYPDLKAEVIHYTQLLKELLEENKLEITGELPQKIVYHDPCFLGKQNDVFDEPRYILNHIPEAEIVEFERNRERSLCCEGGGGRMWAETESLGERLAEVRVRDAKELGVSLLAVACPFCILTLDDAIKAKGFEEEMRVVDILEIIVDLI
ncbi:MAG: (Fe-S)-binding protein [Firmicutes bacterium]|nr:(Fe-S)-binding protein [Bacillota bacterium]